MHKLAIVIATLSLGAIGSEGVAPGRASARPFCGSVRGRTLATSGSVRLYKVRGRGGDRLVIACSRRRSQLVVDYFSGDDACCSLTLPAPTVAFAGNWVASVAEFAPLSDEEGSPVTGVYVTDLRDHTQSFSTGAPYRAHFESIGSIAVTSRGTVAFSTCFYSEGYTCRYPGHLVQVFARNPRQRKIRLLVSNTRIDPTTIRFKVGKVTWRMDGRTESRSPNGGHTLG